MRGSRGGGAGGPDPPPLENHKNIHNVVVFSYTGLDPVENHKATRPAFHDGPASACQRKAFKMVFRWRADDGLILVLFGSSRCQSRPPLATLSGFAHIFYPINMQYSSCKPFFSERKTMWIIIRLLLQAPSGLDRPADKSVLLNFFISHPKHMLWVLKRTVSMRRFFLSTQNTCIA